MNKPRHGKTNLNPKLRLAALFLVIFVGALQPGTAHAQMIVFDPTSLAKMIVQWIQQNLLQSAGNATNIAGQSTLANANTMNAQAQIDNANRLGYREGDAHTAEGRIFGQNTGCAMAAKVANAQDHKNVYSAEKSMEQALMSFASTASSGNGPLDALALASTLCKAGLLDTNGTGQLFQGQSCTSTSTSPADAGSAENPASVTAPQHYSWPTCLSVDQNNKWVISGSCSAQDRPALAAMMYCALKHPMTGSGIYGNRQANAQDTETLIALMRERGNTNVAAYKCWQAVAKRMIPPQNGSSGLQQVTTAYQNKCDTMHLTENMAISDNDYNNCKSTGMSYVDLQVAEACKVSNPGYTASKGQNTYATVANTQESNERDATECNKYLQGFDASNAELDSTLAATAYPTDYKPTPPH